MNHIYRLIWSVRLNTWLVVAENARAKGRGGRTASRTLAMLCVALPVYAAPIAPTQLPTNGQVAAGQASIQQSGARMDVNQSTPRSVINWSTFNVGVQAQINFNQPSVTSVTLNRVLDSNPSQIFGSLNANGQVFVVNPNGVLFGSSAQANVGGLVATTLNISDANFMTGQYRFGIPSPSASLLPLPASGRGNIINQGKLTAAQGGYIALLAPEVRNEGVIFATLGTALLAAGDKITLNLNAGSALSYSIDQGTFNALVDNKQLIQADGGQVFMSAKAADTLSSAIINNTGTIQAHTLQNVGGVIRLMGDMSVGTVNVGGTLDASAPSPSASLLPLPLAGEGQGGVIETSAAHVKVAPNVHITTQAANGLAGTWLIDPIDFTIAATGGDMTGAALTNSLLTTGVIILSTAGTVNTTTGLGDVNVNDVVSWSANKLTLNAQRNININANMNATGTASLALEYGQGALALNNTSNIITKGAAVNLPASTSNFTTLQGSNGVLKNYTVITALGAAGSVTSADLQGMSGNPTLNYALGGNIDATLTNTWGIGTFSPGSPAGFMPIGNLTTKFTGTLDGLGHTISNLVINRPTTNYVGLFGYTNVGTVIRNVGLVGGSVNGALYTGTLAGYTNAAISNSYATGTVTGTNYTGGLVGFSPGSISNSYATGSTNGALYVGGLVGVSALSKINNSYATGNVTGTGSNVGGLMGWNNSSKISDSYATGSVTGTSNVGGFVGQNGAAGTINNSYATGMVVSRTGASTIGGLVGLGGGTISNSFWDSTTSGATVGIGGVGALQTGVTAFSTAQMQTQANFTSATVANGNVNPAWDFAKNWVMYNGLTNPLLRAFMTGITVTANSTTQTYNGTGYAGGNGWTNSATPTGVSLIGTVTYSGTSQGALNAGTYTITPGGLSLLGGSTSQQGGIFIDYVNGTLTINPASVNLTASRVYDSTTNIAANLFTLSGLVGTETLVLSGSGTVANKNVGINKAVTPAALILGDGSGLASNYTFTGGIQTATITPASVAITGIIATNKTYDATTAATVDAAGATSTGMFIGDVVHVVATGVFADKNVANAKAVTLTSSYTGADVGNYTITDQASTTANITPASLAVAAISTTKVFDGIAYRGGNGVSYTGLVNGETPAVLGGTLSYGGTAQNAVNVGTYLIVPSGLNTGNYNILYISGSLTVNPAPVAPLVVVIPSPVIVLPTIPAPLVPLATPMVDPFLVLPRGAAPLAAASLTATPPVVIAPAAPLRVLACTDCCKPAPSLAEILFSEIPLADILFAVSAAPVLTASATPLAIPAKAIAASPVKPLSPATIVALTQTLSGRDQPMQALDALSENRVQLAIANGMNPVLAARVGNTYSAILAQQLSQGVPLQAAVVRAEQVFAVEANFPAPQSAQAAVVKNIVAEGSQISRQLDNLTSAQTPAGVAAFDQVLSSALLKGETFDVAVKIAQAAVLQADMLARADGSPQSQFANSNVSPVARSAVFEKSLSALLAKGNNMEQAMLQATQLSDVADHAAAVDARSPAVSLASGNLSALEKHISEPVANKALSSVLARGIPLAEALVRVQKIIDFEQQAVRMEARNPAAGFSSGHRLPEQKDADFDRALGNAMARGLSPEQALIQAQRATAFMPKPTPETALASGSHLELLPLGNSRIFKQVLGRALAQGLSPKQGLLLAQRAENANTSRFALPMLKQAAGKSINITLADGHPLPNWLRFDAKSNTLLAAEIPDGALPLWVNVQASKQIFKIEISEGGADSKKLSSRIAPQR